MVSDCANRKKGFKLNIPYSEDTEIFLQLYWVNKMINTKFESSSGMSQSRLEILSVLYESDEINQTDL